MFTASYDPISGLYERYQDGQFVGVFASEGDALGECSRCGVKLVKSDTDQQSQKAN